MKRDRSKLARSGALHDGGIPYYHFWRAIFYRYDNRYRYADMASQIAQACDITGLGVCCHELVTTRNLSRSHHTCEITAAWNHGVMPRQASCA